MTELILETGKVQTRDGREVRIYATDADGDHAVHGAINNQGCWRLICWDINGRRFGVGVKSQVDLVPIPQVKYFNVYTSRTGDIKIGDGFDIGDIDPNDIPVNKLCRPSETFRYLNGDITKVELKESSDAD